MTETETDGFDVRRERTTEEKVANYDRQMKEERRRRANTERNKQMMLDHYIMNDEEELCNTIGCRG